MSLPDARLWLFAPHAFAFLLSQGDEYGKIENPEARHLRPFKQ